MKSRGVNYLFAAVVILSGALAFTYHWATRSIPTIACADETLADARRAGFDYESTLASAEQGNIESIRAMLEFSKHTDTAGAYFHGAVLAELMQKTGDLRCAKATRPLSPADKKLVNYMITGSCMDFLHMAPDEYSKNYPQTHSTLSSDGSSRE